MRNYQNLFGEKNVTVLPYDLIRSDCHGFLKKALEPLLPRISIPTVLSASKPRLGPTALGGHGMRYINRLARRSYHTSAPLIAKFLPAKVVDRISNVIEHYIQPLILHVSHPRLINANLTQDHLALSSVFSERYASSNLALAKLVDWNPSNFGYPC